jgi:hypothetical protein
VSRLFPKKGLFPHRGLFPHKGREVDALGHGARFGRYVLTTDSQGFLDVSPFRDDEGVPAPSPS